MIKNQDRIRFPNNINYQLTPDHKTREHYGLLFPEVFENRHLVVLGTQCCGKSSIVNRINNFSEEQQELHLGLDKNYWYAPIRDTLEENVKASEFHIYFYPTKSLIPSNISNSFYNIYRNGDIEPLTYGELNMDLNHLEIPNWLQTEVLFEFRIFNPSYLKHLMFKRHFKEEIKKKLSKYPIRSHVFSYSLGLETIKKGQYLLTQLAYNLNANGVEVYIRRKLKGIPMRFSEKDLN